MFRIGQPIRIKKSQIPLPATLRFPIDDWFTLIEVNGPHITNLPFGVVHRIYDLLLHPRSQIAFSLTCRYFACVCMSSFDPLHRGIVINYSNEISSGQRGRREYGKAELLDDLKQWSWIPRGLRLCKECLIYLPRNRVLRTRKGVDLRTLRHVDWVWAVGRWLEEGKICPVCRIGPGWEAELRTLDGQTKAKGQVEEERRFLQAWPEGNINGVMYEQKYMVSRKTDRKGKRNRMR